MNKVIRNWEYGSMAVKNMTDELNLERVRSIKNTKRQAYNCGGYALENFTWYCPYTMEQDENDETPFYTSRNSNELVDKCVDHMVEEYNGNLRVIKNVKELKPNEYAIAFRASLENDDFHFAKLGRNGIWYHKRGSNQAIETMPKKELFGKSWCHGKYDSKLVLMAMKRKLNK